MLLKRRYMSEELFSQEGKLINKVKEFEIGKKGV